MKALKWLDDHLEEVILVLLMTTIIVVMLMQILFRYVLNNSLSWSEELCRYCFIWFMMIGLSYSFKLRNDLRIDAVVNLFPKAVQKMAEILSLVLCLLLVGFIFYHSFGTVSDIIKTGEKSTALHLPLYYVYVSTVIGYGLSVIRLAQRLVQTIKDRGKESD